MPKIEVEILRDAALRPTSIKIKSLKVDYEFYPSGAVSKIILSGRRISRSRLLEVLNIIYPRDTIVYGRTISQLSEEEIRFGSGYTSELTTTDTSYAEVYRITLSPTITPDQIKTVVAILEWQTKSIAPGPDVNSKWQIGDGTAPTSWTDIGDEKTKTGITYTVHTTEDMHTPASNTKEITLRLLLKTTAGTGATQVHLGVSYVIIKQTNI